MVWQDLKGEYALTEIRIHFIKDDTARFISHLDLSRCISRAIHRSEINIWYTEGYNKHPFIVFSLPLSLGIRGLDESFNIRIMDPIESLDMNVLAKNINKYLPRGIKITRINIPVMKLADIMYARYKLNVYPLKGTVKENILLMSKFLKMDNILVEKNSKSRIKKIDLKEYIRDFKLNEDSDYTELSLILPAGNNFNINPSLVIKAFMKYSDTNVRADITREKMYNENMEAFE